MLKYSSNLNDLWLSMYWDEHRCLLTDRILALNDESVDAEFWPI